MADFIIAPDGYPGNAFGNDRPTFAGVLRKYFTISDGKDPVSKGWNDQTKERYIRDYENKILPHLPRSKALEDFTEDDFDDALVSIRNERSQYSLSRLDHFRLLMWVVYKAGVDRGLFPDALFWDQTGSSGSSSGNSQVLKQKRELTKKSFSVDEEARLIDWFKSLERGKADGKDIGLAIMFFMGLRNAEACGLDYGDLRLLSAKNTFHCIYVTKTTKIASSDLKTGGKTMNAARILPVFDFLSTFLLDRKRCIEHEVSEGSFVLPETVKSVDSLPIVCRGTDYGVRAKASDLTEAGRLLFEKLGIRDKMRTASLQETLFKQKLEHVDIGEKEPTTYLFRRNCATHLYALGMSAAAIQYYIGHEVEIQGEQRNFFTNEDRLADLYKVIQEHPFNRFFSSAPKAERLKFRAKGPGETRYVKIVADEPMDAIVLQLKGSKTCTMQVSTSDAILPEGFSRKVNIRSGVNDVYDHMIQKEKSDE